MPNVALNAHLLSAQANYRSAGIHGYIYHTLQHLPNAAPDWRFHVLVSEGQPMPHPHISVHRSRISTTRPIKRIFWEQIVQPFALRGLQPDLYHAMAFVAPLWLNVPGVVTVHDLSFILFPGSLSVARRLYLKLFTAKSCKNAARVIATSQNTAKDVQNLLAVPGDKIDVVYSGASEDFRPLDSGAVAAFRSENNLPDRFILHLGTLEPRKNLAMLVRAYAALPEKLRDEVHLVLAGGRGWDYDDVFAAVESGGVKRTVHMPGYVARESLPLWYNAAELFVYPSLYEGWGIPVIEAMACGCPTLVSDTSSLPEAAGDTGKRLPPDDAAAWTDTLYQALTDAQWRQTSSAAGIARARQFTWQKAAAATIRTYQRAMNFAS